jgi:WS/DGAT/MGAT family acyltransferase
MTQRVSPLDATFLYAERASTALHVGGVLTFGPPTGGAFDVAAFTELVGRRVALVPRLRQTVRAVPGRLGGPVWVDDGRFDLAYHVRHLALPAPGTDAELRELVGALLETPLDRTRPLWEVCVVEGLTDGRTALVAKIHHALADGVACMRLGAVLLDATAEVRDLPAGLLGGDPDGAPGDDWRPAPAPSDVALAVGAALRAVTGGGATLGAAFGATVAAALSATGSLPAPGSLPRPAALGRTAESLLAGALAGAVRAAGPAPVPALRVATGPRRRFGTLRSTLADHRTVRRAHGGTVNDVVLAVVAGGLRRWLAGRGQEPSPEVHVRALVPVSLRGRDRGTGTGNGISAHLVDLPVGLDDPLERLARVRAAMDERKRRGPVPVDVLSALAGAAPPALHELGARLAGRHAGRLYDVLVSNVPGPPRPLYARGAPLLDLFPAVPLGAGQAVAVGVASYAGGLHYGITADGDAVPDVDDLAAALEEALAELVVRSPRPAPPASPAPVVEVAVPAHGTAGLAAV